MVIIKGLASISNRIEFNELLRALTQRSCKLDLKDHLQIKQTKTLLTDKTVADHWREVQARERQGLENSGDKTFLSLGGGGGSSQLNRTHRPDDSLETSSSLAASDDDTTTASENWHEKSANKKKRVEQDHDRRDKSRMKHSETSQSPTNTGGSTVYSESTSSSSVQSQSESNDETHQSYQSSSDEESASAERYFYRRGDSRTEMLGKRGKSGIPQKESTREKKKVEISKRPEKQRHVQSKDESQSFVKHSKNRRQPHRKSNRTEHEGRGDNAGSVDSQEQLKSANSRTSSSSSVTDRSVFSESDEELDTQSSSED